jgi:GDP-L-fucose synthase
VKKVRIFLTGGSGMVGRNFLEHPAAKDFEILAPSSAHLNLCDFGAVRATLEHFRPNIVVHAAGKVGGIQANIREPVSFLINNLDMGRNIVLASRDLGVRHLLNLGSSCMYPRDAANPLREESVLHGEFEPTNEGYALAKVTVARLCEYIGREQSEFKYKTLMPCNIYGRYDKFDPQHSHMVPAIIHKLHQAKVAGSMHVDIWGDGKARREFMYAGDLVDCMWQAVLNFEDVPDMMNVGLGHDLSVNEYYEALARVVGYAGGFLHDLSKPVGMKRKLLSVERAKSWGWQASTSLENGLTKTYEYYLTRQDLDY